MDDWQLIRRFVAERSEEAFGELVRRHLDLVYSAALRVTREPHLAEDVSQGVFVLLARKARQFREKTIVPGWLYRTTQFVALRAMRAEQRRQRREQEAFSMQQTSLSSDEAWRQLAPVLDEAMAGLSAEDRDALVLRYFEDEPLRAVGERMGISEEAARKKVDRSLKKLQVILERKDVKVSAGVLGAAMTANSVSAAPATLAGAVIGAVVASVSTSAAIPVLVRESLNAWRFIHAVKLGSLVAGVLALLLLVQLAARTPQPEDRAPKAPGVAALQRDSKGGLNSPREVPNDPVAKESQPMFAFQAVDAETHRGIAGARVLVMLARDMQDIQYLTNLVTDAAGFCAVPVDSAKAFAMVIGVLSEHYQARSVVFGGREPVPQSYSLSVPRGSTIGGVVLDETGNPVPNAGIFVQFFGMGDSSAREFQRERPGILIDELPMAVTDNAGRWTFSSATRAEVDYSVVVRHPSFAQTGFQVEESARSGRSEAVLKLSELRARTAVMKLKNGLRLRGVVRDEQGRPVQDATVSFGRFRDASNPTCRTLADGSFHLQGLPGGVGFVTITAPTYAPERREVQTDDNVDVVEVRLKPGKLLRVRVVDEDGKAVHGANVRLEHWRGNNSFEWGGVTDHDGWLEWNSAPHEPIELFAMKPGFAYSRDNRVEAGDSEHRITLEKPRVVSGFVVDAVTKLPIELFKAIPGTLGNWDRHVLATGTNGSYQVVIEEPGRFSQLRFEADGYEPFESPPIPRQPREATCDAQLRRIAPEQNVRGRVLSPDGSSASGVSVALCSSERGVTLGKGRFLDREQAMIVRTDKAGNFVFPSTVQPYRVVSVTPFGFGASIVTLSNRNLTVQLQPWGRIEGHLTLRGRSAANQQIHLMAPPSQLLHENVSFDLDTFTVKTDAEGNFVFEQAPAGEFALYRIPGLGIPFSHESLVTVPPAGTVQVQMGGTGTVVKGHFSQGTVKVDWKRQLSFPRLSTKLPPLNIPKGLTQEQVRRWMSDFNQSEEGIRRRKLSRSYGLEVEPDGTFSVDGVSPGIYELSGTVRDSATDDIGARLTGKVIGRIGKEIAVSADANGAIPELLDVGAVNMEPVRQR